MKTKEQIQNELDCGTVFTVDEFEDAISEGEITSYDGYGIFMMVKMKQISAYLVLILDTRI